MSHDSLSSTRQKGIIFDKIVGHSQATIKLQYEIRWYGFWFERDTFRYLSNTLNNVSNAIGIEK